jgi:hypothetical protein
MNRRIEKRLRCEWSLLCEPVDRLTTCDCCGLKYCAECAAEPDEGGNDCPNENEDCNLCPARG